MQTPNRSTLKGFTLLEVMITVAVLGILAAVSIVSYSNYITKSKLVEAVILFDAVRQNVLSDYYVSGGFPNSLMSAISSNEGGSAQISGSANAIANASNTISEYWYYENEAAGLGWFGMQLNDSLMLSCAEDCRLHIGFKESGSSLDFYCGLWNSEDLDDVFPLNVLPRGCQETCVRCRLNEGDNALDFALNNPGASSGSSPESSSGNGSSFPDSGTAFTDLASNDSSASNNGYSGNSDGSGSASSSSGENGSDSSSGAGTGSSSSGNSGSNSSANNSSGSSGSNAGNSGSTASNSASGSSSSNSGGSSGSGSASGNGDNFTGTGGSSSEQPGSSDGTAETGDNNGNTVQTTADADTDEACEESESQGRGRGRGRSRGNASVQECEDTESGGPGNSDGTPGGGNSTNSRSKK